MAGIDRYLTQLAERDGSDLHLSPGLVPKVRVHGSLMPLGETELSADEIGALVAELLSESQRVTLQQRGELDWAYELSGVARFRVNVTRTLRGPVVALRLVPTQVTPLDQLDLPSKLAEFTRLQGGLVLVTGPTGCGKSTTLAALLDHINTNDAKHIMTIEDPIEFVHENKRSHFAQREVGVDVASFASGIRAATRQDPDVLLIGELRDPETIALALRAAETGMLVFSTLHTSSTVKTVERIVDVFPVPQQSLIRVILADTLRGVCTQRLLPRRDGGGRVPVTEVLLGTAALGGVIREDKASKIVALIEGGRGQGMMLMDDSLKARVERGEVAREDALPFATQASRLTGP